MKKKKSPIAKRIQNLRVSAIRQMPLLARGMLGVISLGQGIPSLETPLFIREGVADLLKKNDVIGKYSTKPGILELRQAIAKRISTKKFAVDPDKNLFISAGAMAALASVITAIVEQGDEVIVFDPGYPSHIELIEFAGGKPVFVPLNANKGWTFDHKKLKTAITKKTKALIVCSPSNPTGTVFKRSDLDFIVALAKKHGFYLIGDQTYEFLAFDGHTVPTLHEYPEIHDQLILCYSFSKEFAMTGWRVGYLYAPEEILAQALKVHDAFLICTPTISQYAALIALTKKPKRGEPDIYKDLSEKRKLICHRLDKLHGLFSYAKPQGAYYVFAKYKVKGLSSWEFALKMLHESRVISIPGSAFGPSGEGHVRFSYGASKKDINEAFARIEDWSKSL